MRVLKIFIPVFIIVFIFGVLLCPFVITTKSQPTRNDLVIRFDDYGIWCSDEWVTIEEKLLALHEKYNMWYSYCHDYYSSY